jgi:hypothetical protein
MNENLSDRGQTDIRVPAEKNELIQKALDIINNDIEIKTLWRVSNVNAMDRLKMPDHGSVHFQIVANIALRLTRILHKSGVEMSITKNFGLPYEYGELVVLLTSLFHDFGISINRDGHEEFSLIIANNILRERLTFLPLEERVIVTSEVLHAIINHRSGGRPQTIEGGIVRVADALDMSQGRSRVGFEAGTVDIHSISAYAIDSVELVDGEEKPIQVNIFMNNSAGLFQVDELLKKKIKDSGIAQYLSVKAYVKGKTEKKILKEFTIK